jgi:hypothetical protein
VLQRVKEERNILSNTKRRKAKWIGHILRRNCLLNHLIEGKMEGRKEMMIRRRNRCKQLLDDIKEKAGCWKLKAETPDRILRLSGCERGYEPVCKDRQPYE